MAVFLIMMRIFVAIELPVTVAESIGQTQAELKHLLPPDSVRWMRPHRIHLTLKFIGEVASNSWEDYRSAMVKGIGGAKQFPVQIAGFGCFPNMRRPRVLWLGVEERSGSLEKLQAKIEENVEQLGISRDNRPFKPHLTLGRVKRQGSRLAQMLRTFKPGSIGSFKVREITLFESELRSTGAVYTKLATAETNQ
jgi:2'-5' RNA ligase